MEVNQIKYGSFLSYLQMALNIVIGLICTPLMIRFLGKSEYGLYNTVASTISSLSILSLGFNSSYIRYYARYKAEDDKVGIEKLNGLFIIIFSIIGVIALLCGFFLTFHLKLVFSSGLTEGEYGIARALMILFTINLAISFPMSVFTNIISAYERFVFLKLAGMLNSVAVPLITILLLFWGGRSIGIVTVTVIMSLIVDGLYLWYVFRKLKCKFRFKNLEKKVFVEIFTFSIFIAINMIVDQINTNIDKILLGRFKGTEEVAIYAVASSLQAYYTLFSTSISGVFTVQIHRIVNETKNRVIQQKNKLTELFVKVGRIQFTILALVLSGIIFFGKPFINIWAGQGFESSYYVTLLLVVPGTIPLIENLGIEIQRALDLHRFRSIIYLLMAILNLMLSILLCQRYGAIGSAVGTTIAVFLANGLIMNIFYHKRCNIDMILFWKNILYMMRGLVFPVIIGVVIVNLLDMDNIMQFLAGILIYTILYCIGMWHWAFNDYEKQLVIKPVVTLKNRLKC